MFRQAARNHVARRPLARFSSSSSSSPSLSQLQKQALSVLEKTESFVGQAIQTGSKSIGPIQAQAQRLWEASKPAGAALVKGWESGVQAAGPRAQRLNSYLLRLKEPIKYNLSVAREIAKIVYRKEQLSLPSWPTFKSSYAVLFSRARSPAYWRSVVRSGEVFQIAVWGVEAWGIFKIGEILGRRHLVGYGLKE